MAATLALGVMAVVPGQAAIGRRPQPASATTADSATYVYVANAGSGSVSAFDVASPSSAVLGAPVPVGAPWGAAAAPDGSKVYVTAADPQGGGTVRVLTTDTNTVTAVIPVGRYPQAVVVSPDGGHVWVADSQSGTASVIDTATDKVAATVAVGGMPSGLALTPDGRQAYVATTFPNIVRVVDTATLRIIRTIPFAGPPQAVAITPDGSRAYVTQINGDLQVLDTATGRAVKTYRVSSSPIGLAISPDGSKVYGASRSTGTVWMIDTAAGTVRSIASTGARAFGVAMTPDGTRLYVTDEQLGTVTEIDGVTGAVLGTTAVGTTPYGVAVAKVTYPGSYLDRIQAYVKAASPGLEHVVWERTHGNLLDTSAVDWALQTPLCWGRDPCPPSERPGTQRLLLKMTQNIAAATATVDMTSLGCPNLPGTPCGTYPEGDFRLAIANGLKAAAQHHPITFRLLMGAPVLQLASSAKSWISGLQRDIGRTPNPVRISVGVMTTSRATLHEGMATPSWNHSKLLVVDGSTLIEGGVNTYQGLYINTPKPVTDMMMAVKGPAAGSATEYLNRLWKWACDHRHTFGLWSTGAWVYPSGSSCIRTLTPPGLQSEPGNVDMLEVGGLGADIQTRDPASDYELSALTNPADARCTVGHPDRDVVNFGRDYQTVNPEETALRAMVATATSSIVFSQQDLYGWCADIALGGVITARQPLADLRLLDQVAGKMIRGVKVRIVISTPGNEDSYSTMKNMAQLSDLIRKRIAWQLGGDVAKAEQVMVHTLQYASLRSSAQPRWLGDLPLSSGIDCNDPKVACTYAQHTKLIVVDDRVFYLGSKNAYPAFLQDDGYFVEDPDAVAHLKKVFLDPQWQYSQADATYDWTKRQ